MSLPKVSTSFIPWELPLSQKAAICADDQPVTVPDETSWSNNKHHCLVPRQKLSMQQTPQCQGTSGPALPISAAVRPMPLRDLTGYTKRPVMVGMTTGCPSVPAHRLVACTQMLDLKGFFRPTWSRAYTAAQLATLAKLSPCSGRSWLEKLSLHSL